MIRIPLLRLGLSELRRCIPTWAFEIQGQTLLAVEKINAFVIIPPALPPEHDVYPARTTVNPCFDDYPDTKA